ncbi:MAG TPA: isoprenylcysteine carboxylmethyltransferase family protein [Terracidiphilus sp.]|jgi:protein-S-isoprenylcysteine O-methyltransferase Ste14
MKLNIITLTIIAVFGVIFFRQALGMPWTPSRTIGLAIAMPALLMLIIARIQLGRAFSVQAKATALVTSGLYSRIRNPIYVFGALFILGIIVWTGRAILLLIFAVLVPLQIYRSRKESAVLHAEFGDAYLQYKRKTWF